MPGKIADPNIDVFTQMGQELAAALVQVFVDQEATTVRVFLWAACLQCLS